MLLIQRDGLELYLVYLDEVLYVRELRKAPAVLASQELWILQEDSESPKVDADVLFVSDVAMGLLEHIHELVEKRVEYGK